MYSIFMRVLFYLYFVVFQILLVNQCLAAGSPEACIGEIRNAIIQADEKKFEKLVNVDGIINDALDIFLQEISKPGNAVELPPLLAILFSQIAKGGTDNNKLKMFLSAETKSFVINGISTGAFSGSKPVRGGNGMIAPLFHDASTGKKEIRNIGKARIVKNGWIVPFFLHDFGSGYSYRVRGLVNKSNKGFRLVAIENIKFLLIQINNEYLHNKAGGIK